MAIIKGTSGNDQGQSALVGTSGSDVIEGFAGDDSLHGLGGNDVLNGGADNDTLFGGSGEDTLIGGSGNDTYHVDDIDERPVEFAGEGVDQVIATVSHTLSAHVENLTLVNGGIGNGNELDNRIEAGATSGTVFLDGKGGDDTLIGSNRADQIGGGEGDDVLSGRAGDDTLDGGSGNDTVSGGDGNDWIIGDSGNDSLLGGSGNDALEGGLGRDRLDGGAGQDTCRGGTGSDTYVLDLDDLAAAGSAYTDATPFSQPDLADTLEFTGGQLLDLTTLDNGEITGIEVLDLTRSDNAVKLSASDVVAMSDHDDLVVMGNRGDSFVSLQQDWTHAADVTIGGQVYEHYVRGNVDVFVDSDMTQIVS